jgi:isopropylmalate/homocitrate/citramalate synthase
VTLDQVLRLTRSLRRLDAPRVVVCHPDIEQQVREAVDAVGSPARLRVVVSRIINRDEAFVMVDQGVWPDG